MANTPGNEPSLEAGAGAAVLHAPPTSTYQAWSRSFVEMYTIAHEWTIENFIELDEEASVCFKVLIETPSAASSTTNVPSDGYVVPVANATEELKFKLSLKPRYGENRDYISLYVHNINKKDLKYSLVFNILSVDKEKKLTRRADTRVHAPSESWGFPKFCQRSEVVEQTKAAEMLPEGTLTVVCEIGGFKRISNRSDYQRVRDQFDSSLFPDLAIDLSSAFEDMEHSDLKLRCGDKDFPCHKFMLASRSDVFRAMFAHDMKENQLGVVQLEDTEPQVVKQFLAFIYTDHFDDTSFATVSRLLPLAEKYNVKRLCSLCGQSLLSNMNADNVSDIAVIGQVYNVSLLKNKAIEYISQYPDRVMRTPGWTRLLKQAPDVCTSIICRLSRIGVGTSEVTVVKARSSSHSGGGSGGSTIGGGGGGGGGGH